MWLGAWKPAAAIFGFTLSVPLLSGLTQTALLTGAQPLGLVFSALWLGVTARSTFRGQKTDDGGPFADQPGRRTDRTTVTLITDLLITAVLLSLSFQFWRHRDMPELWSVFSNRSVFGYGEQFYFLSSAFLWLQGLYYFRTIITHTPGTATADWIRPLIASYGVTIAFFVLIQYRFDTPEGWALAGFQSPYEDISSLGSIAVTVFVFLVATQRRPVWPGLAFRIFCCIGMFVMVAASWSRAAWLATLVFLLLIAWLRISRRVTVLIILSLLAAILVINANADRPFWKNQMYLMRLVTLVRFEKVTNKDAGRFNLYQKGAAMIAEHPLLGFGIGSFYLTSVKFARPGDPNGHIPDFAHNIFLQLATEMGMPLAVFYTGICGWILYWGLRSWIEIKSAEQKQSQHALTLLGITLSLGVYLETGMTGNSLNVYISNQLLFWFLMAAVLAAGQREYEREGESQRESGVGKITASLGL